jgi:hypothetical protein
VRSNIQRPRREEERKVKRARAIRDWGIVGRDSRRDGVVGLEFGVRV